jgi:hypothetical protein
VFKKYSYQSKTPTSLLKSHDLQFVIIYAVQLHSADVSIACQGMECCDQYFSVSLVSATLMYSCNSKIIGNCTPQINQPEIHDFQQTQEPCIRETGLHVLIDSDSAVAKEGWPGDPSQCLYWIFGGGNGSRQFPVQSSQSLFMALVWEIVPLCFEGNRKTQKSETLCRIKIKWMCYVAIICITNVKVHFSWIRSTPLYR